MPKPTQGKHFDHEGVRYPHGNRPAMAAHGPRPEKAPKKGGKHPAKPN